jgi:hypothetical protein
VRALREEAAVKDTRIAQLQTALEECRNNPVSPAFVAKKGESTGVSATPLKWHQLKHIQTGDKWYKVPDVASFHESAVMAREVLPLGRPK